MVVIEEGRCVHQQIIQSGLESDVIVGSSLVEMYAKCGSIEDAWRVFNKMSSQNVVTWNAILRGCAMQGHGLVDEGRHCSASMVTDYMVSAKLEHYTCMVDLLGRAGHLWEAENMIMAMPWKVKGVKKQLGRTWIEVNNEVLMFVVEDEDHLQIIGIHAELQILSGLMHDMVGRAIMVRDANHFHHFEDGVCSCMDYW
ncbi:unnamed protein product [Sphagnum balticum]